MSSAIEKLRAACLERGVNGIRMIGRTFRNFAEGNGTMSKEDLQIGTSDYGIQMSNKEIDDIVKYMDKDGSGKISFDEFLQALRPPMSQDRRDIITEAFHKLDTSGSGTITLDTIRSQYDVSHDPDYKSGKLTEDQILENFMESLGGGGDEITEDEFTDYYSGVSASVDDDEYFCFVLKQAWKL